MKSNNSKIDIEDILALDRVINLIKDFSNKNPIKKYKINFKNIKEKVNQLKSLKDKDNESKYNLFKIILRKLKLIVKREFHPELFFIIGGHGGVIINDLGFCEFDSPKFAINRLLEKMELAIKTNMPYHIEIAISCLEWLNKKYPEKISEFLRLFKLGRFEIINPTFSQPYSLIIGAESNIKQFECGLNVLKQLGLDCNIYYCSESSIHPQIPQILKGFEIEFGSLRTRLIGLNPTTPSGNIDWIGLDNTRINTITEQSGIFNGEYWHGTFFKEIPNLLFQSVSRPFMNSIVYSSIEDFIMPQPYQEEIWRISRFSEIFGKFISCSEFFQKIEKDGEFKFLRDNFVLADSIFVSNELFLNNKKCEISLLSAEILNCILGLYNETSSDFFFDDLWKKLLLTQAHDNYAVPFIRSGDYSAQQLSREELHKLEIEYDKISISELSLKLQNEIQNRCIDYSREALSKLAEKLGSKTKVIKNNNISFLIFNPTAIPRRDAFSIQLSLENPSKMRLIEDNEEIPFQYQNSTLKFMAEIPRIGFKIYSLTQQNAKISKPNTDYSYIVKILEDHKTIEIKYKDKNVCELKFQSKFDYNLSIKKHYKDNIEEKFILTGELDEKTFQIELIQYNGVNRLEFNLDSNLLREIILIPKIKISKVFINYPFGIEETKRTNIKALDFLWLKGKNEGIIFMQKNSQKFHINRHNFKIRNFLTSKGRFEFALSITNGDELHSALNYTNSFQFRLLGIRINNNYKFEKKSMSFLTINQPVKLINLWRRKNNSYLRIFNPSDKQNNIQFEGALIRKQLREINFNYNEIKSKKNRIDKINPWKIRTFKI